MTFAIWGGEGEGRVFSPIFALHQSTFQKYILFFIVNNDHILILVCHFPISTLSCLFVFCPVVSISFSSGSGCIAGPIITMAIFIARKPTTVWLWLWLPPALITSSIPYVPYECTTGYVTAYLPVTRDWWLGGDRCVHEDEEERKKKAADSDNLHLSGPQIKWWGHSRLPSLLFRKSGLPKEWFMQQVGVFDPALKPHVWHGKPQTLSCEGNSKWHAQLVLKMGPKGYHLKKKTNYVTKDFSTNMVKYCWKYGFLLGPGSN